MRSQNLSLVTTEKSKIRTITRETFTNSLLRIRVDNFCSSNFCYYIWLCIPQIRCILFADRGSDNIIEKIIFAGLAVRRGS